MKKHPTLLKTTGALLVIIGLGLSNSAQAVPSGIEGNIAFSGTSAIDGTDFVSATRFTLFNNVVVGSPLALSGDYLGTQGSAVSFSPFIFDPPNASTPITPLWSFVSGANTYSFDLNVMSADIVTPTELFLSGQGTAYITGVGVEKTPTTGFWSLSSQSLGQSTFTFSSSSIVPDPRTVPEGGATVALMGLSMLGLAWMSRKQCFIKTA